ncbi:hypothetical protein CHS0354_033172 [Potamilus streckersoni]|uniref:TATA element modulatory factor 1 TATA binding domain-containing protein n=1 Tax=Potamilus streckersoni TaxID=2493646 RepID=A0AAE0VQ30_9BIVA|nr:hypothetical protein CHS0354_033172 [Potamilus streckersoni]
MSWWDRNSFTNFANQATQALKNAQKKIDKVLDIKENDDSSSSQSTLATVPDTKSSKSSKTSTDSSSGDFWNTWLGSGGDEAEGGTGSKSSWALPWGGEETGNSKGSPKGNQGQGSFEKGKTSATELKKDTTYFSGLLEEKTLKRSEQSQIASKTCEVEKKSEVLNISDDAKNSSDNDSGDTASSPTHLRKKVGEEENVDEIMNKNSSFLTDGNQAIATSCSLEYIVIEKNVENVEQKGENVAKSSYDKDSIFPEEIDNRIGKEIEGADNLISGSETTVIDESAENVEQLGCDEKKGSPMSYSELKKPLVEESSYRNKLDSCDSNAKLSESSKGDSLKSAAFDTGIFSSVEIVSKEYLSDMENDMPVLEAKSEISTQKRGLLTYSLTQEKSKNESSGATIDGSERKLKIPQKSSLSETAFDEDMDNVEKDKVDNADDNIKDIIKEAESNNNIDIMAHPDGIGQAGNSGEVTLPEVGLFSLGSGDKMSPSQGSDLDTSKLDISMETQTSEETLVEQESLLERGLFQDETYLEESKRSENQEKNLDILESEVAEFAQTHQAGSEVKSDQNKNIENNNEISPASSFVMLEDSTDDNFKNNDNNSDTHSNSTEKSEFSRSIHSNHESSDEIDTTTSSDIEIISIPTPNGENRQTSPIDPIPFRIAISRGIRDSPMHSHRRADSFSSTSTNSRDGSGGQMSPGRDHELAEYGKEDFGDRVSEEYQRQRMTELPALDEEDDNPLHPQRLLKKLAEMAKIVEVRESKLVQLSKENMDLMETNNILKSQLQHLEEVREAEMADINVVTTEFTHRMAEMEKRLQGAIREKEMFKSQVQQAQEELQKRAQDTTVAQQLAEKDMQIAELMHEGEKLSKQQLQNSTIIKKLRTKEKENESVLTSQKKKLESQKEELEHLYKVLESKEDLEKKQTEAINQLNIALQKLEKEVSRQKSDLDDAEEKVRSLQVALDNSYREIAELHKSNAVQDSKLQEAALSTEIQVREELKFAMEKQQQQAAHEKESLIMQIEDLRMSIARTEKEHSRREDMLRQEITDLQHHLQEDEARNQELTQSVTFATRPLLRQIENLQSTYSAQSSTWERVEKNLTDRLSEAQNQLAVATEKERSMTEQVLDIKSRVTALESQNSLLRQEKSRLTVDLEMAKSRIEVLEDTKNKEIAQSQSSKQQLLQDLNEVKREKVFLETQLDMEKTKVEQEKKKVTMYQEQIRDMERELQRTQSRGTPSPVSISRHDSVSSFTEASTSFMAISQDDIDRSFLVTTPTSRQSLYETLRQNGAANLLENLQSQLKLKEGEIIQLQSEIQQLERTRESMARELVNLSNENEKLKEQVEELPELSAKFKEQSKRNEALLLMYGEKVEEANELRMDLHDIKEMYKSQIDHLLAK